MKNLLQIATIFVAVLAIIGTYRVQSQVEWLRDQADVLDGQIGMLGAAVTTTASSDTLETFRTNVNADLAELASDNVSTTTANTWTAVQTFSVGVGTSLGIASTSPFTTLGIGTATATTTVGGGKFCMYFKDEAGRGMWIKLATSGNTVFATSTSACN